MQSKAATNLKKHGVSFDDEPHSINEQREIIIGYSQQNLLLLICFTERSNAIRIISARLATRKEREDYERNTF
ncbi:BrnT family toxin [Nostoc sp.]|uniref:BrnT family toxin n=1 Tax=Nostoc sp. TaxID=1180 RepID=UPI003FA543F4